MFLLEVPVKYILSRSKKAVNHCEILRRLWFRNIDSELKGEFYKTFNEILFHSKIVSKKMGIKVISTDIQVCAPKGEIFLASTFSWSDAGDFFERSLVIPVDSFLERFLFKCKCFKDSLHLELIQILWKPFPFSKSYLPLTKLAEYPSSFGFNTLST